MRIYGRDITIKQEDEKWFVFMNIYGALEGDVHLRLGAGTTRKLAICSACSKLDTTIDQLLLELKEE